MLFRSATNAKGDCNQPATNPQPYCFSNGSVNFGNPSGVDKMKDAGRSIAVISVSKSF